MKRLLRTAEVVACTGLILVIWQILSVLGALPKQLPPPSVIFVELLRQLTLPNTWTQLGVTLAEAAAGLVLAVVIAVPAGMLMGGNRIVYRSTILLVELLRPIPTIAIVPLLILLFGIGAELAIVLAFITAIWPLLIQSIYGVRDVDPVALDTARVYGLNHRQQYFQVIAPSAAPYVATGLRLAATYSLIVAIAASLIVGGVGLGSQIAIAADAAAYPTVYALVTLASLLGLLLAVSLGRLEKLMLHWHHSHREVMT